MANVNLKPTKGKVFFVDATGLNVPRDITTVTVMELNPSEAAKKAELHRRIAVEREALDAALPRPQDAKEFQAWEEKYHKEHNKRLGPLHHADNSIVGPTKAFVVPGHGVKLGEVLRAAPANAKTVEEVYGDEGRTSDRDRLQEMMQKAGLEGQAPYTVLPLDKVPTHEEAGRVLSSGTMVEYTATKANAGKPAEAVLYEQLKRSPDFRPVVGQIHSERGEVLAVATYVPQGGKGFDVLYFPKQK